MSNSIISRLLLNLTTASFTVVAMWIIGSFSAVYAQPNSTSPKLNSADNKAETILTQAVEALGGANYLNVRTVVGRGFYTPYQDGLSQLPSRFLDYIAYPDKERTEFSTSGIRVVQTNSGS